MSYTERDDHGEAPNPTMELTRPANSTRRGEMRMARSKRGSRRGEDYQRLAGTTDATTTQTGGGTEHHFHDGEGGLLTRGGTGHASACCAWMENRN
jgi:hypothetical protein